MKNASKNEINKVVELTQDTAKATLNTSVEVVKLAENSIQGLYKVGYDLNASGLNVAKGYWDALSAIRNEWINLFQQTGEKAIDSIGTLTTLEVPFQKEVSEFGGSILVQGEKVFNMATRQVKAVANNVSEQVEKATKTVSNVSNKVEKTTANISDKVEKAAAAVSNKAEKTAEKTVKEAAKAATEVAKAAEKTAEKTADKVVETAKKAASSK